LINWKAVLIITTLQMIKTKKLLTTLSFYFFLFITSNLGFEIRPRFLILPGFGNDAIDYINPLKRGLNFGIVQSLSNRGYDVDVVPIQRYQWLNILSGIFSPEFWKGSCTPQGLFEFYFRAVDDSVREIKGNSDQPLILIGHSAGGWLARGILGNGIWEAGYQRDRTSDLVVGLITLGAPHLPPVESAPDMTRGALRYVDVSYPGAHLNLETDQSIFYVTVAGTAVKGDLSAAEGSMNKFATGSYTQVTGKPGDCVGDGVVPLSHAHLSGAERITLDCFHSIQSDNWYGGDSIIDKWLPQAMLAYSKTIEQRRQCEVSSRTIEFTVKE
jgi:hypothetical protein